MNSLVEQIPKRTREQFDMNQINKSPRVLCEGRYKIKDILGRSEWSTIYDCYDLERDDRVVVKAIKLDSDNISITEKLIKAELEPLLALKHDHLTVLDHYHLDQESEILYLILEWIPGSVSLSQVLATCPAESFTLEWRTQQAIGLLEALNLAHSKGVLHQRINVNNILYHREERSLKLMDFGLHQIINNYATPQRSSSIAELSEPDDLRCFGQVLASLICWREPPNSLQASDLDDFFADLIPHGQVRELRDHIKSMLNPSSTEKLKLIDTIAALDVTRPQEHLIQKQLPIILTHKAIEKARREGLNSPLEDMKSGFHILYTVEGHEQWSLCCIGRRGLMRLIPSTDSRSSLKAVDYYDLEPTKLIYERERGTFVNYKLVSGSGSAQPLIELAKEKWEERQAQSSLVKSREDFLSIPSYVLRRERERLECIRIKYKLTDTQHSRHLVVEVIAAQHCLLGDRGVHLQHGYIDPKFRSWIRKNDNFSYNDKEVGIYHAYDEPTLTIKLTKGISIPRSGVLICEDKAQRVAIDRQEQALMKFKKGELINKSLPDLLMLPHLNTLAPRHPLELTRSDLEPYEQISDLMSRMMAAEDLFVLQGPPGTGKTTVITELICQLLLRDPSSRILLTSQANEAVNNAVDALREQSDRLNMKWRIVRDARAELCDTQGIGFEADFEEWCQETRQKSITALSQIEDQLGLASADQVRETMLGWSDRINKVKDVQSDFAECVQVWATTLLRVPSLEHKLKEVAFDYVIIDEAARATTAELLVAMNYARKVILVGDHKQLPPFFSTESIRDLEEAKLCVEEATKSLFEILFEHIPLQNKSTLTRQFRMHSSIGQLVADLYYQEVGIEHGTPDENRELHLKDFSGDQRAIWLDVPHGHESQDQGSKSYWNKEEINEIRTLLTMWERELAEIGHTYSVGVIAAYSDQRKKLKEQLRPDDTEKWKQLRIKIDTVDAFQGKQEDLIIYSMVRANTSKLKFISDPQRLNVAFSRAKRLLVIVGQKKSAEQERGLKRVIDAEQVRHIQLNRKSKK